jgi:hypothetical protein
VFISTQIYPPKLGMQLSSSHTYYIPHTYDFLCHISEALIIEVSLILSSELIKVSAVLIHVSVSLIWVLCYPLKPVFWGDVH